MSDLVAFVLKRLVALVVLAFVIVTVVFFLAHATPYDPIRIALGQHATGYNVKLLRHEFGLDQPEWKQYLNYLGDLLHGNLGRSEEQQSLGAPVWGILQAGIPVTMKLGFYALVLALLVGLPIGLLSALRQNSIIDHVGQGSMVVLYVIPSFVLAPLCQVLFGDVLHWLPVLGWGTGGWALGGLWPLGQSFKELILPVGIYAAGLAGFFSKSFRSFMLEVLRQDYVRTARAKGLKNRIVIYRHAVKNTLLPLASIIGPTVAYLVVGAFIIEVFFSIPGIAGITAQAAVNSDFAVIEATTLILAIFVIVINMLTDIFYAFVDPRVRL